MSRCATNKNNAISILFENLMAHPFSSLRLIDFVTGFRRVRKSLKIA